MRSYFNKTIFTAAVLAAGLAACTPKEPQQTPAAPADGQPVTGVVKADKVNQKTKAGYVKRDTYFSVPALEGGQLDLAAYAGKPVLFMLFTESCPYCRKAAPALEKLHKTYGSKGLKVAGLCIEDNPQAAKDFAADLGTTFPLGYAARAVYKQYRAQGVPFIFLLNGEHKVNTVWPGYSETFDAQMVKEIEKVLPAN